MTITHGMNPDEVDALGRTLKAKADRLRGIAGEIGQVVHSTQWEGSDGAEFVADWPMHRSRLEQLASQLDGFGQSALNNASEQRAASNAGGSPAISSAPWPASLSGSGRPPSYAPGSAFGEGYDGVSGAATAVGFVDNVNELVHLVDTGGNSLGLITVPFDTIDATQALMDGRPADAVPGGAGLVLTGLGVVAVGTAAAPVVAAGGVGSAVIGTVYQQEHTINSYLERTYGGVDNMTTAQATEFSHRYDGWTGFGRWTVDGAYGFGSTQAGNVGEAAKSVWNWVF